MHPSLPNFYAKNLAVLKKNHPETWSAVKNTVAKPTGEVFLAIDGTPGLRHPSPTGDTITLHNEGSPAGDSLLALQCVPPEASGTAAIFGIELGYAPLAICKQRPAVSKILLFEPLIGIFQQALQHLDLTELFSDPRLTLHVADTRPLEETLAPLSVLFMQEDTYFVTNQNIVSIDPAYQQLQEAVHDYINAINVNAQTSRQFGKNFLATRLDNLCTLPHNHLFEQLKDAYTGIPAILVAGGPSLDNNIDLLLEARNKAIIIAVDGALPALMAHNIQPDFITAVDHKDLAHEKIAAQASSCKNTSLLCTPTVNVKTPRRMQTAHTFWAFTQNPVDNWIRTLFGGTTTIPEIISVAHLNIVAAKTLGCAPLILVGQDFAFTGDSDHAAHSVVSASTLPADENPDNNSRIIWTAGTNGNTVPTTRGWLSLKTHFEALISEYPGTYINSSPGGAKIEGTEYLPLEQALAQYCTKEIPTQNTLHDLLRNSKTADTSLVLDGIQSVLNQSRQLQTALNAADNLTTTVLHDLEKHFPQNQAPQAFSALPQQTQRQITILNAKVTEIDAAKDIWSLLYELTQEGLEQNKIQEEKLKHLQNQPGRYLQYLQGSLERIQQANKTRLNALNFFEKTLTDTFTFLSREKQLVESSQSPHAGDSEWMNLALHYLETGHLTLARPILENLLEETSAPGEIFFQLGCLAALQADHPKADAYFNKAIESNGEYEIKINRFRETNGDYYFNLYQQQGSRLQSLLHRGIQHCATHVKTNAELALWAIRDAVKSTTPAETDDLIRQWQQRLQEDDSLQNSLHPAQGAELHAHYGQLCMMEAKFAEARECFQKSAALIPDNPDYHILALEASFSMGDFDIGIEHLNKAVAINPAYARYWEEIGDSLWDNNQPDDAILAYQNCLKANIQSPSLLQKIEACAQAINK